MQKNLSIYVHWPFCLSKCPYCDFNSYASKIKEFDDWIDAYVLEIKNMSKIFDARKIKTIYFGGGTPSLLKPHNIKKIIDSIFENFCSDKKYCEEITIEINPCTVNFDKLKDFFDVGINRVSIGLQSIYDDRLKFLKRTHSAENALQVLEWCNKIFDNVSFDMIYGVPRQSLKDWEKELKEAIKYAGYHLSLYQLHLYENTPFFKRFLGKTLQDDLLSDMYYLTRSITQSHGMQNYEVSNYSFPNYEGKHNLCYWECGDYLGIGPGAHGRITSKDGKSRCETFNDKFPKKWKESNLTSSHETTQFHVMNKKDCVEELMMMSLRLADGVSKKRLNEVLDGESIFCYLNEKKIERLCDQGVVIMNDNSIKVSKDYFIVLDHVVGEILT